MTEDAALLSCCGLRKTGGPGKTAVDPLFD